MNKNTKNLIIGSAILASIYAAYKLKKNNKNRVEKLEREYIELPLEVKINNVEVEEEKAKAM